MLNKLSFKLIVDSVLIVDRRPKSTINTLRAKLDQGAARKKKEERHGVPGGRRREVLRKPPGARRSLTPSLFNSLL